MWKPQPRRTTADWLGLEKKPAPPGDDRVSSRDQKSPRHLQLRQPGDEHGDPPGLNRPARCGNPALLEANEIPADTTLVRFYQPNQSPHVVAVAVGEAAGSADLHPSAATAAAAGHTILTPSPPLAAEAARSSQTKLHRFSSSGWSNDIVFGDTLLSNAN